MRRTVRRVRATTRSHPRRACPGPVVVTMPSSVPPQDPVVPVRLLVQVVPVRPLVQADPAPARRVPALPVPVVLPARARPRA